MKNTSRCAVPEAPRTPRRRPAGGPYPKRDGSFRGKLPHEGSTVPEIMRSIEKLDPPRLETLRPSLPEALSRCVMKCLEKKRESRYRSAEEVLAELEGIAEA